MFAKEKHLLLGDCFSADSTAAFPFQPGTLPPTDRLVQVTAVLLMLPKFKLFVGVPLLFSSLSDCLLSWNFAACWIIVMCLYLLPLLLLFYVLIVTFPSTIMFNSVFSERIWNPNFNILPILCFLNTQFSWNAQVSQKIWTILNEIQCWKQYLYAVIM